MDKQTFTLKNDNGNSFIQAKKACVNEEDLVDIIKNLRDRLDKLEDKMAKIIKE